MKIRWFILFALLLSSSYAQTLNVAVLGSFFESSLKKHIFPSFEKKYGIKVDSMPLASGSNAEDSFQQGRKAFDVVMLTPPNVLIAQDKKLIQPIKASKVPNLSSVLPDLIVRKGSDVYAVGTLTWYISLVTNSNKHKTAPKSWKFLWSEKNKVGLRYSLKSSYLLDITARTFFPDEKDIFKNLKGVKKVVNKAAEVDKSVKYWFQDGKDFLEALEEGEIESGSNYHDLIVGKAKKGKPFATTFPKEGAIIEYGSFVVAKDSQNVKAATLFMNYMLSKEVQVKVSKLLGTATALKPDLVKGSFTEKEFAERTSLINPIVPDASLFLKYGDYINKLWEAKMQASRDEKAY